jgi:hypothetical protein
MNRNVINNEEYEKLMREADWFKDVEDQLATFTIFIGATVEALKNNLDPHEEWEEIYGFRFNPSDDAVLRAAVEICKVIVGDGYQS